MNLYDRIKAAVTEALIDAGEDVNDYNVNAMVSVPQVLYGQMIGEYNDARAQGEYEKDIAYRLAQKYGYQESSIRALVVRNRKERRG